MRSPLNEQVLVLDLTFFGDAWKDNEPFSYAQILDDEGDRPMIMGGTVSNMLGLSDGH